MKQVKERFKKLIKTKTVELLNEKQWEQYQDSRSLTYNDYRICLYLHIPFCCDCESKYIKILINDIEQFVEKHKNKILYGFDIGGCPTALSKQNFTKLLEYCGKTISFMQKSSDFEQSIECDFSNFEKEKLSVITQNGFNRISFKFEKDDLDFAKIFEYCNTYNIKKINIDISYGNLSQKKKNLKQILKKIKTFKPTQVTLYKNGENYLKTYNFLFKKLTNYGYYSHYGQNTFSLHKEDLGLSSYQRNKMLNNIPYFGFGVSAQSQNEEGVAYNAGAEIFDFISNINTFNLYTNYFLPKEILLAKYLENSKYCGRFDLKVMEEILQENPFEKYKKEIKFLKRKKYIKIKENIAFITKKGFKYYDIILSLFYPEK